MKDGTQRKDTVTRRHPRGTVLLVALASQLLVATSAQAYNKCTIGGKVVFQDAPCDEDRETLAQGEARKARYAQLERKLDIMQARGSGMVQAQPPKRAPREASEDTEPKAAQFGPRRPREEVAREFAQRVREKTERTNAESAARLTDMLDKAKQNCGAEMADAPKVGMTDEYFRQCTKLARFGGVTQVVVAEEDGLQLRLYVFPGRPVSRVYSIGGIVTSIKP